MVNFLIDNSDAVMLTPEFRDYIEYSLPQIRSSSKRYMLSDGAKRYRNIGNFYKLLQETLRSDFALANIPFAWYHLIMRVNWMVSPDEYTDDMKSILIPDSTLVRNYVQRFNASTKM